MKRCSYCFEMHETGLSECPHCSYVEGAGAQELYHLFPGTLLKKRYVVGQVLGFGGFGITYKVWDETLKTVWAIKEYFPSGLTNRTPGTREVNVFSGSRLKAFNHGLVRFVDEARSMAKFNSHKNIINVMEYFEENNTAYIVMEYLDGITLSEFLKSNRMDCETSIEVICNVLLALKEVHQAGIIHRDVSPDNIFLCTNGVVKLIDFGAARFSSNEEQQRTIILKPGFAPPEQYEKINIQGPWTDIYAVGATLYYMLTGMKPEESTNRKIKDNVLPPHLLLAQIPEYVSNTVMQAMSIDSKFRFSNVDDFEKGLLREKEVLPLEKQIKRKKYRRYIEFAAVFVLLVLASSFLFTNWQRQRMAGTLPDATIYIAFGLTGDSGFDAARRSAFEHIIASFTDSFPNVDIRIRSYPREQYERILMEARANNNFPTLFESTGLQESWLLDNTRSLSAVVDEIPEGTTFFLENHERYFPAQNQIPLSFNLPALFINTLLSDFDEGSWDYGEFGALSRARITLEEEDEAYNEIEHDTEYETEDETEHETEDEAEHEVDYYTEDETEDEAEHEMDYYTEDETEYEAEEETIYAIHDYVRCGVEVYGEVLDARSIFTAGRASAYISDTSAFFEVQRSLPARYRLVNVSSHEPVVHFSDLWSISRHAAPNEHAVAERFLLFLLSDYAQDILHVRLSEKNLPINVYTLGIFSWVHGVFYGFLQDSDAIGNTFSQ